eukprot:804206-Pyramimonas_sp.AAC.1
MFQAKRAGLSLAQHLGDPVREDASSETRQAISRAAARSSELRGCLLRNAPGHLARGSSELRVARM